MFKSNHVLAFTMNKYHRIAHRIHDTWCITQCLQDLNQIPYHPCMVYIPTFTIKKQKNEGNIPVPMDGMGISRFRNFRGTFLLQIRWSSPFSGSNHSRAMDQRPWQGAAEQTNKRAIWRPRKIVKPPFLFSQHKSTNGKLVVLGRSLDIWDPPPEK